MRTLAQFIGVLLVVGFVLKFWWLIVLVVTVVLAVKLGPEIWREYQADRAAQRAQLEQIAAREDQQHAWVLRGDDRGVHGPAGAELMRSISWR